RRSAAAQALADGKIHMAEGLPARAVQIVGDAVSGGCSCFEEEVADGCSGATNRHVQRAGAPVDVAFTTFVGFGALEERQKIGIAPASAAIRRPAVVVAGMAAQIHHAVDGAGATDDLALRPVETPAAKCRDGFGAVVPVIFRL